MQASQPPIGRDGQQPAIPRSVFITGASGFIGRALAQRYRALGCEVRGMDLRADAQAGVVAGNLTEPRGWADHARGCDLFVNTAAVVSMAADWDDYRNVSVRGARHALDAAVAAGAKRFLHYSSVAALGWQFEPGADEGHPVVVGPDFRYGVAKGASEHAVLQAHAAGEIDCTVVRPGDVYGPGSRAWLVEPLRLCRNGTMTLPAHGEGVFSPVYIDDLLDGTMLAAGVDAGRGQIFHIAGGFETSCREYFGHHWRWSGRRGKLRCVSTTTAVRMTALAQRVNRWLGRRDEACPDSMYLLARRGGYSIAKARRLLGYEPKIDYAQGMALSEAWLREIGELK
ncbi:MAG: NAD(P)-dependent oxidoreductase [Burkholderiales bacterium]|nr:NAD(P)-dependent oxidoreductase [Burkholderiales bacterium]